jgi:hypothetical protein
MPSKLRGISILVSALLLATATAVGVLVLRSNEGLPGGESGAPADGLARELEQSVNIDAWRSTGAIRWSFRGVRHHLWDKRRNFVRVRKDDQVTLLDLSTRKGAATIAGKPLSGKALSRALEEAYSAWANDSFWLNPLAKLFDPGTTRRRVRENELLVTYQSGGVTPGDSYLWLRKGPGTKPHGWKMWVSVIPIGGVESTWEGWTQLSTGAWVATRHTTSGKKLELKDVAGAASLEDLGEKDAFAELARAIKAQ